MNIWSYITIRCSVASANHNNPLPASLKCNTKNAVLPHLIRTAAWSGWSKPQITISRGEVVPQSQLLSCVSILKVADSQWKNTTMLSGYILLECFLGSLVGGQKDQDWTYVLRAPCNVQISCKLTLTRNSSFHQILLQPISGLIGSCDQSCRKFFSLWN